MRASRTRCFFGFKNREKFCSFLFLACLYLNDTSCNVLSGYFVKLPESGNYYPDVNVDGTSESTMCAHRCLGMATCRFVARSQGTGPCIILETRPPAGIYSEVLMRAGYHMHCLDAKKLGVDQNTIIPIQPTNSLEVINVFCDMQTSGGGWIVIQRRLNGKVSFHRDWINYQKGFGNLNENFWLGLDNLHILTSNTAMMLRIELRDSHNRTGYAEYSTFRVASSADFYRLTASGYTGNVGDALSNPTLPLRKANGQRFSTYDKDNDASSAGNCAVFKTGGWWFNECYDCHPNGRYGEVHGDDRYISWIPWNSNVGDIAFIEMKIRPLQ